ncbi:TetR/AcrR family transcriptional regulator [Lentilactobacillus raoultii]|uniref:TetR/AcrR family transcriptional regulator n=1 Tax=Lentilactobacillus raoultii TaxID=1987503 RepID=A0ABW3PL13_9LACO|nr:TetR/AcrR family transcriptional regulator [Lentilactobacillus raoultii]
MEEIKIQTARAKIIEAARKLFENKGVDGTSIRDIAKEAGYSHTTIYLYFGNKQELFNLIAEKPLKKLYLKFEEIYESDKSNKDKFLLMCEYYVAFGIAQRQFYPLLATYDGERIDEKSYKNDTSKMRMKSLNLLEEVLKKIISDNLDGELRVNLVRGVFYFLHGTVMTYISSKEPSEELIPRLKKIVDDYFNYTFLKDKFRRDSN